MKTEITDTHRLNLLETCYYEFKPDGYDGIGNRLYLDVWYDINFTKGEIIQTLDEQIKNQPKLSELGFDFLRSYSKEYFDNDNERLNWFIEFTQSEYFKSDCRTHYSDGWLGKDAKRFEYYENLNDLAIWEIRKWIDYKMGVSNVTM